jgi:transposase
LVTPRYASRSSTADHHAVAITRCARSLDARLGTDSTPHILVFTRADEVFGRRNVIERCLEWTARFRRLVRRYEREASHFLGFLRLACAVICYRRAIRLNLLTTNNPK